MGVMVKYCGHNGSFIADVWELGPFAFVQASAPVKAETLDRVTRPTHRLSDFPKAGIWQPHNGMFVVPKTQVEELRT